MDQFAALPTLGMPVSFLASTSTLKFAPHIWPELSTRGSALNSFSGCSKLLKPPEVVKKHPEKKKTEKFSDITTHVHWEFSWVKVEMNNRMRKWSLKFHLNVEQNKDRILKEGNNENGNGIAWKQPRKHPYITT